MEADDSYHLFSSHNILPQAYYHLLLLQNDLPIVSNITPVSGVRAQSAAPGPSRKCRPLVWTVMLY